VVKDFVGQLLSQPYCWHPVNNGWLKKLQVKNKMMWKCKHR